MKAKIGTASRTRFIDRVDILTEKAETPHPGAQGSLKYSTKVVNDFTW